MAVTEYNFTISTGTANGKLRRIKLHKAIRADGDISTLVHGVRSVGDTGYVEFADALTSEEQTAFNALVAAHEG